jgi:hypothetical protein
VRFLALFQLLMHIARDPGGAAPVFHFRSKKVSQQQPQQGGSRMRMKLMLAASVIAGLWATSANAIDLADLAPCRPAAELLCDRSGGMTWNNLLRCGATLAAQASRLDGGCIAVLIKYRQLIVVTAPAPQASLVTQRR